MADALGFSECLIGAVVSGANKEVSVFGWRVEDPRLGIVSLNSGLEGGLDSTFGRAGGGANGEESIFGSAGGGANGEESTFGSAGGGANGEELKGSASAANKSGYFGAALGVVDFVAFMKNGFPLSFLLSSPNIPVVFFFLGGLFDIVGFELCTC